MNHAGIYAIRHKVSGKVYVGSARNIERRLFVHECDLKKQRHHSILLQRAWNKYGAEAFEFTILESTERDDAVLLVREQWWLDHLHPTDPKRGYNLAPVAGSVRGIRWSEESRERKREQHRRIGVNPNCREARKRSLTPESLREMQTKATEARYRNGTAKISTRWKNTPENRAAHIAKLAENFRGKALSKEHREKISTAHKGRPGRIKSDDEKARIRAAMKAQRPKGWNPPGGRRAWTAERIARRNETIRLKRLSKNEHSSETHEGEQGCLAGI